MVQYYDHYNQHLVHHININVVIVALIYEFFSSERNLMKFSKKQLINTDHNNKLFFSNLSDFFV